MNFTEEKTERLDRLEKVKELLMRCYEIHDIILSTLRRLENDIRLLNKEVRALNKGGSVPESYIEDDIDTFSRHLDIEDWSFLRTHKGAGGIKFGLYYYLKAKGYTCTQIGKALNKNHATIISGIRKFDSYKDMVRYPEHDIYKRIQDIL